MSFAATTQQIKDQTKTVTRRIGWQFLKAGDLVQPVVKGMGLGKGEKAQKIGCPIRILAVQRVPLNDLTRREVLLEGFPELEQGGFVQMFSRLNKCRFDAVVTRIEFEYTESKRTTQMRNNKNKKLIEHNNDLMGPAKDADNA